MPRMATPAMHALPFALAIGAARAQAEPVPVLDDSTFRTLWLKIVPSVPILLWAMNEIGRAHV